MLAVRLGPHGHGPGFGRFLYPGKPVWLPLNEKTVGPFLPPPVEFFFQVLRKFLSIIFHCFPLYCRYPAGKEEWLGEIKLFVWSASILYVQILIYCIDLVFSLWAVIFHLSCCPPIVQFVWLGSHFFPYGLWMNPEERWWVLLASELFLRRCSAGMPKNRLPLVLFQK